MKKILCLLVVLFMGMLTLVFAETKIITNEKNEYGGKTTESTFSPGEQVYKEGTLKIIGYYGSNGKIAKGEIFRTEEHAKKNGVSKTITYYDGKAKKFETFFTDESARKDGISKGVGHYNSNGKKVKESYYDLNGKIVSESCYNNNGKAVKCPKR